MSDILDVRDLTTQLISRNGLVTAVDHVNLKVRRGSALALVGESGSGKSMTCSSLMGVLPANGRVVSGQVLFNGEDLLKKSARDLRQIRGRRIGMVLQDAMTSLNPLMTIGDQIAEVFRYHHGIRNLAELRRRSIEALEAVKIPAASERLDSYPFQFSGGMRQRVSIAINIACAPDLLFCDEPTTALDVTVQLQILALLRELQQQRNMSIVFITHDLRLASQFCDDVAIMYAGRIVERGPIGQVFRQPVHPYTEALLRAAPALGTRHERLLTIPGAPSSPNARGPGCRFAPRCPEADERCRLALPDWFAWQDERRAAACWHTPQRLDAPVVWRGPGTWDMDARLEAAA
ncbi:dipeptide/oligopeptide/nickel ABC transporter ATP-binding protein [Bordetella genomosp. 10]|uniref:Dipeptide/oligopeptide/nickel ABC transporter ATP-binding protein n=1 Tax=Bordetella genomosp. 10 TaxID=1416804 RepID=A0A261SCE6_9BORD|nr:ABC transporter ATP-binding protein [Bordetella genomosp. 10]OZI34652.1 dipeptide/oligopeptide/nickel ABC transporter ATP-binding protein [Bordetella genomosp. 10]